MISLIQITQIYFRYYVIAIFILLFLKYPMEAHSAETIKFLLSFKNIENTGKWIVVNDDVMGGVSKSNVYLHSDGYLIFAGDLSTDYGGGFASIRTYHTNWQVGNYEGIILKVKGDGKTYQFRCRLANNLNQIAYRHYFNTNENDWQRIFLPFKDFLPTYRGRVLRNLPKIDPEKISQFGIMISDKQVGNFKLKIDWIGVY